MILTTENEGITFDADDGAIIYDDSYDVIRTIYPGESVEIDKARERWFLATGELFEALRDYSRKH